MVERTKETYWKDVIPKTDKIDRQTVDKVINNMSLTNSPDKYLIIAF